MLWMTNWVVGNRVTQRTVYLLLAVHLVLFSSDSFILAADDVIPCFGIFEQSFRHAGAYKNPYVELTATAEFTEPDGQTRRTLPLFWDGEATWRLRFSPDKLGQWSWRVTSSDAGLSGQSGRLRVVPSDRAGSIRPMQAYPYHFERQDGTPFWFIGDTAWALYSDSVEERHDREAAGRYITARAEQGFNVVHSMLLSEAGWGNRGGPPWHDVNREMMNPNYWQEVDQRVRLVNQHGMIAGLAIAWGDKRKVEPFAWRRFPSVEARKRYARYVAARYSAFDVYFLVSGEWHAEIRWREQATEEEIRREFVSIGDALAGADPHDRMVGIHPMTAHGSVRQFVGTGWMSFGDYQQNYHDLHGRLLDSRSANLPIVNAEYGYFLRDSNGDGIVDKHNSFDVDAIRHASWDIAMAGGYFVTGFGTTYFGGHRDPGPFDLDAEKNDVWEAQIQHIRQLFTSLEWWQLHPQDELITSDISRDKDGTHRQRREGRTVTVIAPPAVAYWLLADPGNAYVAYVRGCETAVRIQPQSGTYLIRQFDPRAGKQQILGTIQVQEEYVYRPPDRRDWVLLLNADQDKNPQ